MHKIIENFIEPELQKYLLGIFAREQHYNTQTMEKASLPMQDREFVDCINKIIQNATGAQDYVIVGDNFYRHAISYFPHCDAIEDSAWMNIVIPLKLEDVISQQKFIVFDQTWQGQNATWVGNLKLKGDFYSNKKISERPCDSELLAYKTNMELPLDIWQHIDNKYFNRDYFYGMSGSAYNWAPGNVIVFDSQHVHATGRMQCKFKTGLSIRIAHK
jgi:hypothetical protein